MTPNLRLPRTLFFEFADMGDAHRAEIVKRLEVASIHGEEVRIVENSGDADAVVRFRDHAIDARAPEQALRANEYVWSMTDFPSGFHRGLYCSLSKFLFSRGRHDSYCYPIQYNEQIAPYDISEAKRLFSFVGAVSSGVRARMIEALSKRAGNWEARVSAGPWTAMYDRSGTSIKRDYAESIRRSKYVLCPRGNGVGSIRMFEVMEAMRAPVIISDAYVPPSGVDWNRCAIFIREKDVSRIPEILREHEPEWPAMAAAARAVWESHFSPASWATSIAKRIALLQAGRTAPSAVALIRMRAWRRQLELRRQLPRIIGRMRGGGE